MEPEQLYHIFNRGNNKSKIFFTPENYQYFLRKVKNHIGSHADILAYCLMSNHFHLLVHTRLDFESVHFSKDLMVMLRSYTRAINKQENRTGSLFQQHTKKKLLTDTDPTAYNHDLSSENTYPLNCFHYIHLNPVEAGLVRKVTDYQMSSIHEYITSSNNGICNIRVAKELVDIGGREELMEFYRQQELLIR